MTDHKFTDDEIIKALECCRTIDGNDCKNCAYRRKVYGIGNGGCTNDLVGDALALINRQKVEIESLKIANEKMYSANKEQEAEIERLQDDNKFLQDRRFKEWSEVRAEAIKEFAERLKANMSNIARMEYGGNIYFCVGYDLIDTLVKEMTEEQTNESQST